MSVSFKPRRVKSIAIGITSQKIFKSVVLFMRVKMWLNPLLILFCELTET